MSVAGVVIPARYEEWFRLSYLSMEPALASADHSFTFGGERFKITLPDTPAFEDFDLSHAKASVSIRLAATNEPVAIYIYAVLVTITGLDFSIPAAAAKYPHDNASLYTEDQRKHLDDLSDRLWKLARDGIDYWLRLVRSHTQCALIRLQIGTGVAATLGGSLINSSTGKRFYTPSKGRGLVVPGSHRLRLHEWQEMQTDLAQGASPPIWNEYLMTGCQRIDGDDLRAAVIDLATCLELAIRRHIELALPRDTPAGVREIVARTNMSNIFSQWQRFGLPPKNSIPKFSIVRTLFEVRNSIAHRGRDLRVTKAFCIQASDAARELLREINA